MNRSKKVLRNSVILSVLVIVCTLVVGTTIGLFTSTASADLNDSSLVAYWNLDEATGSVISDAAQNNTGATTGDPLHVAGKIGRALSFTSGTQYATIGNSGSGTTPLPVFTLSFWIKTSAANGTIISDPTSGFSVFLSGGKVVVKTGAVLAHDVPTFFSGRTALNNNAWHMVTITRNGGGLGNLYVDTIRDNETNGTWGFAGTTIKPAGLLFNRTPQNTSGNFIGKLDDVRIYNRAFNDVNDDASLAENAIGQLFVFQAPVALVPHLAFTIVPNDNIDVPTASYEFIHQAETTLTCLLDGNSFTPCTSPASLSGLAPSIHTFVVTATDEFGVQNVIEDMFIFTLPPPPITSDPGSEDDQDGAAGIISDPSSNDDQDGAAGIISDPGSNDDQDGPAGIISNPSGDDDQDAPGVNTSPILILVGTNAMTVLVDSIFIDPGAHAVDAQDGTLTSSIQTTGGPVVTSSPQTFTLTYTVTDSGGLAVSATRTVTVVAAPQPAPLVISDPSGDAEQDAPAESELAPQQLAAASQSFSSSGSSSSGGGSVLGVTTTATSSGKISDGKVLGATASCGIYLPSPLYFGVKNDAKNVEKLQAFLNEVVGSNLTIDGIFGQTTVSAVKKFQLAHKDMIIDPWIEIGRNPRGIATGYVGPTTLWTINNMVCSELQLPQPVI